MFIFKEIGCRAIQAAFRIALPILPYREPGVISSCSGLADIFAKEVAVPVSPQAYVLKNQNIAK